MSDEEKRMPAGEATGSGSTGFDNLSSAITADRTTLLVGSSGAGKTILALQSLVTAAAQGSPGLFVSFEEDAARLRQIGASFGWNIEGLEADGKLLLHARVKPRLSDAGFFDTSGLLEKLRRKGRELGAKRIVLDGLPVMLALLEKTDVQMNHLFLLRDWLFENGFTAFLTANLHPDPAAAGQGCPFLEFVSDCVVALEYQLQGDIARRCLRVVKYRGAEPVRMEFPFVFGPAGIEIQVAGTNSTFGSCQGSPGEIEAARRRFSSRIQALDKFLEMKQAELDFLIEKEAREKKPAGSSAESPVAQRPSF